MLIKQNETVIACDLSALTDEQRTHHIITSRNLFASAIEVRSLPNGYAFHLPDEPQTLHNMADFINHDRLCCPFMVFGMEVEPRQGPIWLTLTGGEGVKEYVAAAIRPLLNEAIISVPNVSAEEPDQSQVALIANADIQQYQTAGAGAEETPHP